MRRHSIIGLLAGLLVLSGCAGSTSGTPAAGTGPVESTATGEASGTDGPTDVSLAAEPGVAVDAAVVEEHVMRPMQIESDDFWSEILELAGSDTKVSAAMVFLPAAETVECAGTPLSGTDAYGPTYCPSADRIVVAETFMSDLGASEVLRADGSFADPVAEVGVYFLLAHQWGHDIIASMVADKNADLTFVPSQQIELTADCFAGLMIAGVPRVFTAKDPESVLSQVPLVGERFVTIQASPQARQDAVLVGLNHAYEDRQSFVVGVDECLSTQAPQLVKALG